LAIIVVGLVTASFSAVLLYTVDANLYFALFVPSIFLIGTAVALLVDYMGKASYYKKLSNVLRQLNEKRFLLEVLDKPDTLEGTLWYSALKVATKSMNDTVARYGADNKDYREYIELWVHEVKTPLAGLKLALENSKDKTLLSEVDKLGRLVDQALFYARSGSVEADYSIRQVALSKLVNEALKSSARYLIQKKVRVELGKLTTKVSADPKWIVFILRQLIENAVKYGAKTLKFDCQRNGEHVILTLQDDGVGISPEDIDRVFDKGFTGVNGRRFGHSTGLGLYLCQKLCQKLGVKLSLSSEVGSGTVVEVAFLTK
jgi:signal transduction histidine kinase